LRLRRVCVGSIVDYAALQLCDSYRLLLFLKSIPQFDC